MVRFSCILLVIFACGLFCQPVTATVVNFELTHLGGDSFKYVYTIENNTLSIPIEQFTIWFDEELYDNLQIATQSPLADDWNEIILPSTGFGIPLGYDAVSLTSGILVGQSVGGFSINFDWLGTGSPGDQPFDIINPSNSQTIESGITIPEPMTLLFFIVGNLIVISKRILPK